MKCNCKYLQLLLSRLPHRRSGSGSTPLNRCFSAGVIGLAIALFFLGCVFLLMRDRSALEHARGDNIAPSSVRPPPAMAEFVRHLPPQPSPQTTSVRATN